MKTIPHKYQLETVHILLFVALEPTSKKFHTFINSSCAFLCYIQLQNTFHIGHIYQMSIILVVVLVIVGRVCSQDHKKKISVFNTPHICHNHHNRWLCKSFESSVKFSSGYMKESALSVIFYNLCNLTHGLVFDPPCNFTQCVI